MAMDRPQKISITETVLLAKAAGLDPLDFTEVVVYLDSVYAKWYVENKLDDGQ